MEYISAREAAGHWSVSQRYVQRLLQEGRISGARKLGKSWMIPQNAKKPSDARLVKKDSTSYPPCIYIPSVSLEKNNPDSIFSTLPKYLRGLANADLAYRRGDPYPAIYNWINTPFSSQAKLSSAFLATVAAICSGEYDLYYEIQHSLQKWSSQTKSPAKQALFDLPRTLAIVSMAASSMTPVWLKNADFSLFQPELKEFLLFLYTLHLRNVKNYAEVRATAQTAYILCANTNTFTWLDINFLLLGAQASFHMHDTGGAVFLLKKAIAIGIPCGFITPFADLMGEFGGVLEDCLRVNYPEKIKPIKEMWNKSFKNWIRFHNEFTRENITTLLTIQEYQVARLIAGGATYAETARRMSLSVSRIKDLISALYGKLYINDRRDLTRFII